MNGLHQAIQYIEHEQGPILGERHPNTHEMQEEPLSENSHLSADEIKIDIDF